MMAYFKPASKGGCNGSGALEPGIFIRANESVCPDDALANWHLA